jgi:hypothetical protein
VVVDLLPAGCLSAQLGYVPVWCRLGPGPLRELFALLGGPSRRERDSGATGLLDSIVMIVVDNPARRTELRRRLSGRAIVAAGTRFL